MTIGYCPVCDAGTGMVHTPEAEGCIWHRRGVVPGPDEGPDGGRTVAAWEID